MKKANKKKLLAWLLAVVTIIVIAAFVFPTDYYVEEPGEAISTGQLVKAEKRKVPKNFYLVTVAVSSQPASFAEYLWSFTQKHAERIPQEQLLAGQTNKQYDQLQNWYMTTSQQMAIYNAAKAAKRKAQLAYRGVYVMGLQKNSSFKHKLQLGDTIVAVDGHSFRNTNSLLHYVGHCHLGQVLKVTVLRQQKKITYQGKAVKIKGQKKAGIGIQLVERAAVKTKPAIKINAKDIGGPSAGLMFSLTCYQIFTQHNLAPGHRIAGTGTIDAAGHVGIIGGADKKVVAADKSGAEVFFAPTDRSGGVPKKQSNYYVARKTAQQIHSKMKVIPVRNFGDAVKYLKTHY